MKWRRSRFGLPLSASRCAPRRPTLSGPSPATAAARRHPGPSGARTAPSVPQPHTVSELSPGRRPPPPPPPQRVSLRLTLSCSRSSSFSASERVLFITHPEALEPPLPAPPTTTTPAVSRHFATLELMPATGPRGPTAVPIHPPSLRRRLCRAMLHVQCRLTGHTHTGIPARTALTCPPPLSSGAPFPRAVRVPQLTSSPAAKEHDDGPWHVMCRRWR